MSVLAALLLSLSVAAGQAPDLRAEAERLAASGAYAEALKRFQSLAAANPDDAAARLWIGRLHLLMGQPRRAAAVFESLVASDAKNVDALAGLGSALAGIGEWDRAVEALNRAESLAPDRIDILAAQGQLHGAAGRSTLALAYYDRALAGDPDNDEIRAAADSLRAFRAHRATLGYNYQRFDPSIGDFNSGTLAVNARVSDALRLVGVAEVIRFEENDETRGGGGIEWLVSPRVLLRGGVLGGGGVLLPSLDAYGEATFVRGRARWIVTLRYFDFDGADLWIAGPGFAYTLDPRLTLQAQYLRGRSRFDFADSETSDNLVLGVHGRPAARLTGFVQYRYGIDRLDWLTGDRLIPGDASTLAVGGSLDLSPAVTVGGEYDHQARSNDVKVHRAQALLTVRF